MDFSKLDSNTLIIVATALLGIVTYFLKGRDKHIDKKDDELTKTLEKHAEKIQENTLALTELKVTMQFLIKKTESLAEIEKDVSALHRKFREIDRQDRN